MPALVKVLVLPGSEMFNLFKAQKSLYIIPRNLLFDAAKFGNAEFINILIRTYPHLASMDNRRFPSKFISHCCYI